MQLVWEGINKTKQSIVPSEGGAVGYITYGCNRVEKVEVAIHVGFVCCLFFACVAECTVCMLCNLDT